VHDPLTAVRRLYDAWNAGDVAAAAQLLSPTVQWESFGAQRPATGPQALQTTFAGSSAVSIDVLVAVVDHVIAFTRRSGGGNGAGTERVEVWTLQDGQAVHYRGYPLDEGLAVLAGTSEKLAATCRALQALHRGDEAGWAELFAVDARGWSDGLAAQRLDDVRVLAESPDSLVFSARRADGALSHLVLSFAGDRARRVSAHLSGEAALAAAAEG
jgi:ketosteroid isomerase-like protein